MCYHNLRGTIYSLYKKIFLVVSYYLNYIFVAISMLSTEGFIVLFNRIKKKLDDERAYKEWVKKQEITNDKRLTLIEECKKLKYKPLISIILPVYNTEEKYLRKCMESVVKQLYAKWELCIADDASSLPFVKSVIEQYRKVDKRIKVIYREVNGHISAASNSALSLAVGEYIALLDHDDELSEDALFECVKLLNKHPEADMIYSDEDKINEFGKRQSPFFKPDWSPDTICSHMYTCHLGLYRTSLVKRIGGFREGFEGSQDYDLVLRISEETKSIYHIPKILYHWRKAEQSTAKNANTKVYAYEAALKALIEHFIRRKEKVEVNDFKSYRGWYRVHHMLNKEPFVSMIIIFEDIEKLERCLNKICTISNYDNYEIVLVQSGNRDCQYNGIYKRWYKAYKNKLIIPEINNNCSNLSSIVNKARLTATGNLLLLLNSDLLIMSPNWLNIMAGQAMRDTIGTVGPKLINTRNRIFSAGIVMGVGNDNLYGHSHRNCRINEVGYNGRLVLNYNYAALSGDCFMVKSSLFDRQGGLDEKITFNNACVDFSLNLLESGVFNILTPDVMLRYQSKKTNCGIISEEDSKMRLEELSLLKNRWDRFRTQDPFYNINLSKVREDFAISSF